MRLTKKKLNKLKQDIEAGTYTTSELSRKYGVATSTIGYHRARINETGGTAIVHNNNRNTTSMIDALQSITNEYGFVVDPDTGEPMVHQGSFNLGYAKARMDALEEIYGLEN